MGAPDFDCAICQRRICMRWDRGRADGQIAPICRCCEQHYGGRGTNQSAGAFRDRREVVRGLALAEVLHCEASQQNWRPGHASA